MLQRRRMALAAAMLLGLAGCGTETPRAPAEIAGVQPSVERRCGWLHNPTPANWWLADRDGLWIISAQGGEQAEGMERIPDMHEHEWEPTNRSYGYGCACMSVAVDPEGMRVLRIDAVDPLPLDRCRADRALPPPQD